MKHIFNEVHYELTRKIAEGGMGMVYEATQKGIGGFRKVVAIKLIREEYSAIEEFRNNFIGEAKLVADLIHTNIVQTYHLGKIGEQYFMTMEFVTGWNLEEFLDRHVETEQYIPADLAVFIVSRICRGLGYAHRKKDSQGRLLGIVHRDVNPKNIMIAQEGDVKLTDFGIVRKAALFCLLALNLFRVLFSLGFHFFDFLLDLFDFLGHLKILQDDRNEKIGQDVVAADEAHPVDKAREHGAGHVHVLIHLVAPVVTRERLERHQPRTPNVLEVTARHR